MSELRSATANCASSTMRVSSAVPVPVPTAAGSVHVYAKPQTGAWTVNSYVSPTGAGASCHGALPSWYAARNANDAASFG